MGFDAKTASELGHYVKKMRLVVATSLFHSAKLPPRLEKQFGFDKTPPAPLTPSVVAEVGDKK
jgi:hypothetical protein